MTKWLGLVLVLVAACGGNDGSNNNNGSGSQGVCGDGALAGNEMCDDGNTMSGDGCSSVCTIEGTGGGNGSGSGSGSGNGSGSGSGSGGGGNANATCANPNMLTLTDTGMGYDEGIATGDTSTSTNQVDTAACDPLIAGSGGGKDHVWQFTIAVESDVNIFTDDTMLWDAGIRLMTTPCDVSTEVADLFGADGCSDAVGAEESEGLYYVRLPAGTYYIVLDGYEAGEEGDYTFTVQSSATVCGNSSMSGDNDFMEQCDDGGTMSGDGCDARCQIEDGWTCDSAEPTVCTQDSGGTAVAPAAGDLKINELMPRDDVSDTNCDNSTNQNEDEFVELINTSTTKTLDLTGVTVSDSMQVRHTFTAMTVAPGKAVVVWGGGAPACPGVGSTMWQKASTGQLGLQDSGGDTVTVKLGTTTITEYHYTSATLNKSLNSNPDITGTTYANHDTITGHVGDFSPGKKVDGTAF